MLLTLVRKIIVVGKGLGGAGFGLGVFCALVFHLDGEAHVFDHVPDFFVGEAWGGEIAIDEEGIRNVQG